jgi:hypothetical protein
MTILLTLPYIHVSAYCSKVTIVVGSNELSRWGDVPDNASYVAPGLQRVQSLSTIVLFHALSYRYYYVLGIHATSCEQLNKRWLR